VDETEQQRHYQQLLARLEANEGEFRRLGRSVWKVQEEERRRLARELHDGIGQNLTALKHRLALLATELGPRQAALRERVEGAIMLCASTLEDTRQLSRLLRPPILDDLGLEPALRWLARSVGEGAGLEVDLHLEPLAALDEEAQTLLFRVAQESLNNAAKHARAHRVSVELSSNGGWITLRIEDDGCGFGTQMRDGSGLGGMRERLRLHGGRFELESRPGAGTRVTATIPLEL
jgi:two-component system sensor histidine kinase UhpB